MANSLRKVLKELYNDGWYEVRQTGSHMQLKHPSKRGLVTVPIHGGDIAKGTLHSIYKQAGLK